MWGESLCVRVFASSSRRVLYQVRCIKGFGKEALWLGLVDIDTLDLHSSSYRNISE
jgi:hypothetical protein